MKVYLSKQNFLLSYRKLVLSQKCIFSCRILLFQIRRKNPASFFLFRVAHRTACLRILHNQTLLMRSLCDYYSQSDV